MRICSVMIGVALLLLVGASRAEAQYPAESPFIYQISSFGCEHEPHTRTLTGFRIKGVSGIITALHGVAGCTSFVAESSALGADRLPGLTIAAVDIDRDLALLHPAQRPELLLDTQGLDAVPFAEETVGATSAGLTTITLLQAYIVGYSYARNYQDRNELTIRTQRVLRTLLSSPAEDPNLGSALLTALDARLSPDPDQPVIDLQGVIVPGLSGAPLFNSESKVVGVGNGGLLGGTTDYVWAIPWSNNICWQLLEVFEQPDKLNRNCWSSVDLFRTRYDRLRTNSPSDIYAFPQSSNAALPLDYQRVNVIVSRGENAVEISQPISTKKQESYRLPVPPEIGLADAEITLMIEAGATGSRQVLASVEVNSSMRSLDGLYVFQVVNRSGSLELTVTPTSPESASLSSLVVTGRVVDESTNRGVARANITLDAVTILGTLELASGMTDNDGRYVLAGLPPVVNGIWANIRVVANEYEDASRYVPLVSGEVRPITLRLAAAPTPMPTEPPTAIPTETTWPTPTATDTPTLLPTATATDTRLATPMPTSTTTPTPTAASSTQIVMPTVTPKPPATATAISTAANTPTHTPTPTVALAPTITPLPSPPNLRPIPTGGAVTLKVPLDEVLKGRLIFSWESSIQLADDEYYEMVFWVDGKEPLENSFSPIGASKATSVTVDLDKAVNAENLRDRLIPSQIYRWGILLVKLDPYKPIQYLGGGHRFRFELTGEVPKPTSPGVNPTPLPEF